MLEERELLKFLQQLIAQTQALDEAYVELQGEAESVAGEEEALASSALHGPPFSFMMWDQLRDRWIAEQDRLKAVASEIVTSEQILLTANHTFQQREAERRQVKEAIAPTARDSDELQRAELRSWIAQQTVVLRRAELRNLRVIEQISQRRIESLRRQVESIQPHTEFTQEHLQALLDDLAHEESELRQQLSSLGQSVSDATDALARMVASQSSAEREVAAELAWREVRKLRQQQVSLIHQRLGEVVVARYCWHYRYKLFNGQAAGELVKWRQQVDDFMTRLNREKELLGTRLEELRVDLATIENEQHLLNESSEPIPAWLDSHARELERAVHTYGASLIRVARLRRLIAKLREELRPDSAQELLSTTGQSLSTFWHLEVASIDDHPITVGKIVSGLILFVTGMLMARIASRFVGGRVLPRLGANEGISQALQSISFYVMVVIFGFFALELLNVPLTVFTFMGGAVAIGVGFGSQNILNNFISGLILLAERPIRVGDLVEVNGVYGTVELIGARSTRVRTGSNMELIIPNSKFLENDVTNWTLSDTRVRRAVTVGVAYGSPTREVERLLMQAVGRHPEVLSVPEPIVLFESFGDNALNFEVHFWIHMRTMMQGQRIQSTIRHEIDAAFREAGITIAFPQRDIHLDAKTPIEVNLRHVDAAEGFARHRAA